MAGGGESRITGIGNAASLRSLVAVSRVMAAGVAQRSLALVVARISSMGRSLRRCNSNKARHASQNLGGACRGEGLLRGQHVPDGLSHAAGDVDPGDRGAALAAEPAGRALVALLIDAMARSVRGGLDERPAQFARPALGEAPSMVGPRRSGTPSGTGRRSRPAWWGWRSGRYRRSRRRLRIPANSATV